MQTFFIDYLEYLFFNNLNVYDKKTIFIYLSMKYKEILYISLFLS